MYPAVSSGIRSDRGNHRRNGGGPACKLGIKKIMQKHDLFYADYSPPAKQYTNKKFYLIQDTLPLPGRLLVQSKQHVKTLVKQQLSSREIGRELDISHQAVLSAIEKFSLDGSNGSAQFRPGQIPFGWDYIDYQLKKNREEQEVIRIIKQLKSSGFSLRGISAELNKQLVPTKNNGIWHANTVKKILERV